MRHPTTLALALLLVLGATASADPGERVSTLADQNGVTITEQLRRSIATEVWREGVERTQGKVLVEDAKGNVREVEFQR